MRDRRIEREREREREGERERESEGVSSQASNLTPTSEGELIPDGLDVEDVRTSDEDFMPLVFGLSIWVHWTM